MTEQATSVAALIKPHPKQQEFLQTAADHEYTLYGGAAGGGKSFILRWWGILRLLKHAQNGLRGVRVGIFCETYPALRDRHLSKIPFEFPNWLGELHEQSHEFRLKAEFGGGILAFRNLDAVELYQSVEFADIAIDELTLNDKEIFTYLNTRRRWPGVEDSKFVAATNPGGRGHAWVKKLWIDQDFSDEDEAFCFDEDENRVDPSFAFVQSKASDNPSLPKSYFRRFVTDYDKRVLRDGDWDVFSGQFFTEWRAALHVVRPFDVPAEWPKWRCVDYGTLAPFGCLWLAMDPSTGRRVVYREIKQKGLTAQQQARMIRNASAAEIISYTVADPSMFNKTGADGRSPSDYFAEEDVVLMKGYNMRVPGWNNVRQALVVKEDGLPGLQIFATCRNLIKDLPALVHDEKNPEDLDSSQDDHLADALRYGLSPAMVPGQIRGTKRGRGMFGRREVSVG